MENVNELSSFYYHLHYRRSNTEIWFCAFKYMAALISALYFDVMFLIYFMGDLSVFI